MDSKIKTWLIVVVVVLVLALIGSCSGGGVTNSCGHQSCKENGPFYCMGKNNTCNNRTYCAYDLYCSACD